MGETKNNNSVVINETSITVPAPNALVYGSQFPSISLAITHYF